MEFNEYQKLAEATAIYPREMKVVYPTLGLAGEAGEVSEKVKKSVRDGHDLTEPTRKAEMAKELGDVLWYISAIASDLGLTLEEIAVMNYNKLKSRQERNVLSGSGDNR